jgi:hypothetical protein
MSIAMKLAHRVKFASPRITAPAAGGRDHAGILLGACAFQRKRAWDRQDHPSRDRDVRNLPLLVFQTLCPAQAPPIALLLAFIPYLLIRGSATIHTGSLGATLWEDPA